LLGVAHAETLSLQTPCFDVNVSVPLETVLQMRMIRNGEQVTVIDRGGLANEIRASACGVGEWIVDTRTGTECVEIDELGQRRATGLPCVWDDWLLTLTATVHARPGAPTFLVQLNQHEEEEEQ
jgi:acyl CoA:acetate/3-ketoacid CoA transferase alpha subunit